MAHLHQCPCGSLLPEYDCCHQFIYAGVLPDSAEKLMRSRFTAYVLKEFNYILTTYSPTKQPNVTIASLAEDAENTHWVGLEIVSTPSEDIVEFKAIYRVDGNFYVMHETSRFIKIAKQWFYHDGEIWHDSGKLKLRRNDLCPCGSQKKAKKCCLQ